MKLKLHATAPNGRCVAFVKQLQLLTLADNEWCIKAGQRLFDGQHPIDSPLLISVATPEYLADFSLVCSRFGITVRSG